MYSNFLYFLNFFFKPVASLCLSLSLPLSQQPPTSTPPPLVFRQAMGLKFFILVNKQGQTRVAQYYSGHLDAASRAADESEIIRKCLARSERQCSFFEFKGYKLVFRRYASLYFIVGVDPGEVS